MKPWTRILSYQSLLLAAIAIAMLQGNWLWLSPASRLQTEETIHEIETTPEATVLVGVRRQDRSPIVVGFLRIGRCLPHSTVAQRPPTTPAPGHRLSHEMLAPLIC